MYIHRGVGKALIRLGGHLLGMASESTDGSGEELNDQLDLETVTPDEIEEPDAGTSTDDAQSAEFVDEIRTQAEAMEPAQANDDGIATYSTSYGPFRFKILPQSTREEGLKWGLWAFLESVQGPILQTHQGITKKAAQEIDLPERLRSRINEALHYVQTNMDLPDSFGSESTSKRSLNDLEARMGK